MIYLPYVTETLLILMLVNLLFRMRRLRLTLLQAKQDVNLLFSTFEDFRTSLLNAENLFDGTLNKLKYAQDTLVVHHDAATAMTQELTLLIEQAKFLKQGEIKIGKLARPRSILQPSKAERDLMKVLSFV